MLREGGGGDVPRRFPRRERSGSTTAVDGHCQAVPQETHGHARASASGKEGREEGYVKGKGMMQQVRG